MFFPNVTGWDVDIAQSEKGVSFSKNTLVRTLVAANVFFILASFGVLGYFIKPAGGLFVIRYNVYFGVEIEGAWWQIFIPSVAAILFLISHFFLARRFYKLCERIAAYIMLFGSCLISIGVLIANISMVFINY